MLKYLKELLEDIKQYEYIVYKNNKEKILALESAIEILEKIRRDMDGNTTE